MMTKSKILAEIIPAQEAYMQSLAKMEEIDIDSALLEADRLIKEGIENGRLITFLDKLDIKVAEKAAIQLNQIGYCARTVQGTPEPMDGGGYRPTTAISICWKYMPESTRDEYTV